ncbi:hypothetical protein VOLCADRAFT_103431 [Volvox carteri f. nagariensis]|uniref:BCAS3 domain-containing protein n=1 Tax=Volvox carteri f. nagariensis TaxID=3068 RepID=D8TLT4_VOLCA|nr:uncharacterized protein VOLCADRAFT_103431 [Volvox carteri f. nagariensis]EFJ51387.1 hypothetical protein VOLCADRAFT_103431 [Volvox carteri f. nagariensis]|eukprot:XP_002947339.1 hypothetical protein VOLCADRAFT_103431 [Volvox carteri f. nagariensis]
MALSSKSGVLHVSFNQDCSCVALGSQQGVHIYNVDTHKLCYRYAIGAVSIVEMLFCTSLVGFVGAGEQPALTPRKLTVMNTSASRVIQELSYPISVLAVRMNRQRLVVVTSQAVHVYCLSKLACLRVIETENNPGGCCALTCCHEPNLLALPSSSRTGTVRIYDLTQEGQGNVLSEVQAHQSPVVAAFKDTFWSVLRLTVLAWSSDGGLLATATAKGTLIRVHRMPRAARSHSFRRGATSATIQSLAFGPVGLPVQLLVAASSHGTVHVFRLEDPEPCGGGLLPRPGGSVAGGLLSAVVKYSSQMVGDLVEPARNIATIRLPRSVGIAICAFRSQPGNCYCYSASPELATAAVATTATATSPAEAIHPNSRVTVAGPPGPPGCDPGSAAAGAAVVQAELGSGDRGEAKSACGGRSAWGGTTGGSGGGWGGVRCGTAGGGDAGAGVCGGGRWQEGLLYEYTLTDLLSQQGPKCNLDGEWSMVIEVSYVGWYEGSVRPQDVCTLPTWVGRMPVGGVLWPSGSAVRVKATQQGHQLQQRTGSVQSPIPSLSYTSFREKLAAMCSAVGIKRGIMPHSMRIGGNSAAAARGVSEEARKAHGRWKTDAMVQLYTRMEDDAALETTRNLGLA